MSDKVAIIGIGYTPLRPATPECSFKELIFEAARNAYDDAGLSTTVTRSSLQSFLAPGSPRKSSVCDVPCRLRLPGVERPIRQKRRSGAAAAAAAQRLDRDGPVRVVEGD